MSVKWNTSKVINKDAVTTSPYDEDKWHPVTDSIVWLSLACGFREITEKNLDDVACRVLTYQNLVGAFMGSPDGPVYITEEDLRLHIGMTTNASVLTHKQWINKLGELAWEYGQTPDAKQSKSAHAICAEGAAKAKAVKEAA